MARPPRSRMDFDTVGIGTALKRNRLVVPLNQREYSWEERHVMDLFRDLADAVNSQKHSYFLGTIVLTNRDDGTLEIADGQQRLATTTILLGAFRDYFHQRNDDMLVTDIENFLYTIVRSTREIDPRLKLNVTDNDFFRRRVLERPDHPARRDATPQQPSHRLIDDAAGMAKSHLEIIVQPFSEANRDDHLSTWIDFIENAVEVILLTVPDDVNAYVMFETLNDRGLRVSQSDLVKNYLFSETAGRIAEAQERWTLMNGTLEAIDDDDVTINFLRHVLISIQGHIKEREVLEKVREKVRGRAPALEFLSTLSDAAHDYVAIQTPSHRKWLNYGANIRRHVMTLLLLKVTPLRPLMLSVARCFSPGEAELTFRHFVSWSVRFIIAGGARSGGVEVALAEAARKVSEGTINSARSLTKELKGVVPDDTGFKIAFQNVTVSNHGLARYYLRTLERKIQNEPEPEWVPNDETVITLEHVLPQNPGSNWNSIDTAIHAAYYKKLGNMVLLAGTSNREIGNDSFDDKKLVYQESTYSLTNGLGELRNWGPNDIEDRQRRLAELAVECWPLNFDA